MTGITKERAFEDAIEDHLLTHGWEQGLATDYHAGLGLDTRQLFTFIGATQQDRWDKLLTFYANDSDEAQRRFAERLAAEIDKRGTIDVLRHGIEDRGVHFELAYFRPANALNPETQELYDANRLSASRQIRYDGDANSIDLVLICNGIPVATAELKNPATNQTVDHATAQYRADRDPRNVLFAKRAVVHFAVDPHLVMMTTTLAGKDTSFLPFNRGDAPGELRCGKGNPPNPSGHATSYLWEDVWQRDSWLDILQRFLHVEQDEPGAKARLKRGGRLIFPRYHQWDAVRRLEADAKENGAGHHYLVQHSAGSGKSNTIAWLAHRLASLHDANDDKSFDKVVVITDRRILDKQLQDTIYQFEHAHGVVAKIEESSAQLAEALSSSEAKIVITTLQKFPFAAKLLADLPERRYAIVIDEAHSSQTGEDAAEMRKALGPAAKEIPDDATPDEFVDAIAEELARARGQQPNISLFAFTATPKARTLEIFGIRTTIDGETRYRPFHVYSMRQAIEEGFILDVLRNYTTYHAYWRVANEASDDPEVESRRAAAAIARFASLHPEQMAQKAEIVVEHVRKHTKDKIGGRAKAMVVCASRLHAVRFRLAVDKYLADHGIGKIKALVAFSGTVTDPDTQAEFTESKMNGGVGERRTAEVFGRDDANRILIVAEKFQTGFDQPLLHTMFVDKKLAGVHAVQTLSRLNRTHPGKTDTFVLDFVNDADQILQSYQPFYETTLATETDPNLLFDARNELERFGVVRGEEVDTFAAAYFDPSLSDAEAHARLYAQLDPARHRFDELDDDDQDAFRSVLHRFVMLYAFVSQVLPLNDSQLEKRYQYCRLLEHILPRDPVAQVDLGELELTHLRVKPTGRHDISLEGASRPLVTVVDGDPGPVTLPGFERLSEVIARVNDQFGLGLGDADRLHFESVAAEMIDNEDIQLEAAANTLENFGIAFDRRLMKAMIERMDKDEKLTQQFLDNPDFRAVVREHMVQNVYERAKVAGQRSCPIGDLLARDEDRFLEFKSSLMWDLRKDERSKVIEGAVIKTVAAFLNSPHGGTLLIGVDDSGAPVGLEPDYASLRRAGQSDRDRFLQHLANVLERGVGLAAAALTYPEMLNIEGNDICRLHVEPSGHPVRAEITKADSKGNQSRHEAFFIRVVNGTREISDEAEIQRYISRRWDPRPAPASD